MDTPNISGPFTFWQTFGSYSTGGSSSTPDQRLGTINDYDVIIMRNSMDMARVNANGLLLGLTSSGTTPARFQIGATNNGTRFQKWVLSPNSDSVFYFGRLFRAETVNAAPDILSLTPENDINRVERYKVVARQTAGSVGAVGDGAAFIITCTTSKVGGVITILNQQVDYVYKVDPGMDFTIAAAGGSLDYTFQGVANRTFAWAMEVDTLVVTT